MDVIKLGKHRLLRGDATNKTDVQKLIGNTNVNLLITDPPYGISIVNLDSNGGGGKVSPQYKYPSEQFRKSRTQGRTKHHSIQNQEGERERALWHNRGSRGSSSQTVPEQSEEPNLQHSQEAKDTHTHLMITL